MADGEGEVVNEPEVSGSTLGLMFNPAPEESVVLKDTAREVGKGDSKAGLDEILKLIEEEMR